MTLYRAMPVYFSLLFFLLPTTFGLRTEREEKQIIWQQVTELRDKAPSLQVMAKPGLVDALWNTFYNEGRVAFIQAQGKEKGIEKNVEWFFLRDTLIYTETKWYRLGTGKLLFSEKTYHHRGRLFCWEDHSGKAADKTSPEFCFLDSSLFVFSKGLLRAAYN